MKIFCLLMLLCSVQCLAQKENNIWTFGQFGGLNFNTSPISFYKDSIRGREGTAAVCDTTGALLFYSDGLRVYDRDNKVMPNGNGLLGNPSSTQGVAIASVPGDDSLYYLFTVDAYETWGGHKLLYNLVDMRLNSGLGDVRSTHKNVLIDSMLSEKMLIAGSCGRNWLLVHKIDSPVFYAYNLGSASPFTSPVRSLSGDHVGAWQYMIGEMKVSRNFEKLALGNFNFGYSLGSIELHNFDQKTGRVSGYQLLDTFLASRFTTTAGIYGLEFSADAQRLYATGNMSLMDFTRGIFQYDLSLPTAAAKRLSKTIVNPISGFIGLRLGPDNRIYFVADKTTMPVGSGVVGTISKPNLLGAACLPLYETIAGWPMPTSLPGYNFGNRYVPLNERYLDTNYHNIAKEICKGWPLIIADLGYEEYHWYDGDTSSRKTFKSPGTYWLRSVNNCMVQIDTFVITEQAADTNYFLLKDTLVCLGTSITVQATDSVDWYLWNDGDTSKKKTITSPDSIVLYTSKEHCQIRFDTIAVKPILPTYLINSRDTAVCPLTTLVLSGTAGADRYKWDDGSTSEKKTLVAAVGKHWVESQTDCTIRVDTFKIVEKKPHTVWQSFSHNICGDGSITLRVSAPMEHYLWSTGDTSRSIIVSTPGKYWGKGGGDCSLTIDSFYVNKKDFAVSNIVKDSSFCFVPSGKIIVPLAFDTHYWNGGNTSRDTTLYTNTVVAFYATNNKDCEKLNKQYNIRFVDFTIPAKDTFTCNTDTIHLDATISKPGAQYWWNTGDTSAKINVNRPGAKTVQVTYLNCSLIDTFNIDTKKLNLNIGSDTVLCNDGRLTLEANLNDVVYKWNTGADTKSIVVDESGTYSLLVTDNICSTYQEVEIRFVNCNNCVAIPNAFTPNGDGLNDYFKPILNCPTITYQLKIFNRWGEEVFVATTPNQKWDGGNSGNDVFYYLLNVSFEAQNKKEESYKGDIMLIR